MLYYLMNDISIADSISLKRFRQQMIIEKNLSNNTINAYIIDIKQFLLFHPEIEYNQRIQKYIDHLEQQRISTASSLRKFTAIKQYCKFLDIYIEANLPKLQQNTQFTHYNDIITLIQSAENIKAKAFLALMFATGGRISEILSIKLKTIQTCLLSTQSYFNIIGKGRKERVVFITEHVKSILDTYIQSRTDKNPYLFHSRTGLNHISRQWGFKTVQQAALKAQQETCNTNFAAIHPHSFRHAQAMMLLESGADLVSIQKILGHAHLSTTERYLKLHWSHLLDGIAKHPLAKKK